jgi:hypothetical protein
MTAVTTATEVQAVATVESLLNPIDQLFVLDRQQKALASQVKSLKDGIANSYELSEKDANGKIIPHRGEKYGVKLTIENRVGSLNADAIMVALRGTEQFKNMTDDEFVEEFNKQFRGESSAIIKVSPTA